MLSRLFEKNLDKLKKFLAKCLAMKAENLHSLERTEHMIVRWMCEVSLKNKKHSEVCSLLGIQSVAEVWQIGIWSVRVGMTGCQLVEGWRWQGRNVDRGQKTRECVNDGIKLLRLQPEWAVFRDMWRGFILGQTAEQQ